KTIEPLVDTSNLAILLAQIPSNRGLLVLYTTTQYLSPSRLLTVKPAENTTQDY
ncbi:hypothetical protein P154DRAFT_424377, partial [Amniculicola lignicola CBS 123094]